MTVIRPIFLRRFYERTFDSGGDIAADYAGATLEEFLHVALRLHPLLGNEAARELAPRNLRKSIPDLGEPADEWLDEGNWQTLKGAKVDLAAARADVDATTLEIRGAKQVTSWSGLARWRALRRLEIDSCRSDALERPSRAKPRSIEWLNATSVSPTTAQMALGAVSAKKTEVELRDGAFRCSWVKAPERLSEVSVSAGRIMELQAWKDAPLVDLGMSTRHLPTGAAQLVQAAAKTLERLWIDCEPFAPRELFPKPPVAKLRHVLVPAFAELREEWITFAVAHPKTAFSFHERTGDVSSEEVARHLDVPIFEVRGAGPKFYEVAADFADIFGQRGDNGDVEDRLIARLPVIADGLSSEAEQIVYRAATKAAAKKFIELAAGVLQGGGRERR